jgi:hypothetical protein
MISCCEQDCVVVLEPFPTIRTRLNHSTSRVKTDFDLQGDGRLWYARPSLSCNYTLCPTVTKGSVYSGSHSAASLVYFSTFERIQLESADPCPASTTAAMICPVSNVLVSAPLIPCSKVQTKFNGGNVPASSAGTALHTRCYSPAMCAPVCIVCTMCIQHAARRMS